MTTVKLRHEYDSTDEAVVLGDVPLSDIDEFFRKFSKESIHIKGDEYRVLFRDYVVDNGEAFLVIGYGNDDDK